ncbi:MAG: hypothetical protein GC171_06600 [Terrimonas sp.]|nr:hypothetical protein [Terrimonas sp.]
MKQFLLLFYFFQSGTSLFGQDVSLIIREADRLESSLNESAAYEKFKLALKTDHRNYYALWKCSELCSRIGRRQATRGKQMDFYKAGRIYAESAIRVDPAQADGYYALSVAMGRLAMMESGNDRIKAVKAIKENADKALAINPTHGRAWHVLGKWHYEVSNLNAVEKAALKIFYGGLPKSSLKESIKAYEKAMQYEPAFALNNLELAKAYHRNNQDDKAIALLRLLPTIADRTEDDKGIKEEGKKLYEKLSR